MILFMWFFKVDQTMASLLIHLPGFRVHSIVQGENGLAVTAKSIRKRATCPGCGEISRRIHSYYTRKPKDLPITGVPA